MFVAHKRKASANALHLLYYICCIKYLSITAQKGQDIELLTLGKVASPRGFEPRLPP